MYLPYFIEWFYTTIALHCNFFYRIGPGKAALQASFILKAIKYSATYVLYIFKNMTGYFIKLDIKLDSFTYVQVELSYVTMVQLNRLFGHV